MSVLLEFSMTPIGKGESVGKFVARSVEIIKRSGLPFKVNSMGTVIEGEWDEVMKVVGDCFRRMRRDCGRISTDIKIDYRKKGNSRMKAKVASIEKRLHVKLA